MRADGHPPNKGFPNATNASTAASDAATVALIRAASQLMLELDRANWLEPFKHVDELVER